MIYFGSERLVRSVFKLTVLGGAWRSSRHMDAGTTLELASATLLANDSDIDPTHDILTISAVGNAVHGSVELTADGHVRFVAEPPWPSLTVYANRAGPT